MKRVIVTGGTGFIGRALVAEIERRYPDAEVIPVGSAVVDMADEHAWFAWLEELGGEVDHIIHLAALYKAGDWPVRSAIAATCDSPSSAAASGSRLRRRDRNACRIAPCSNAPRP